MSLKINLKFTLTALGLVGLGLTAVLPASAGVTALTGGDAGKGFAPLSNVFFSLSPYYDQGVVQNVTFDTNNTAFAVNSFIGDATGGNGPLGSGTFFPVVTANDTNLDGILSHGLFGQNQTVLLTISGLTVGKVYQVDSLVSTIGGGSRDETVTASGLTSFTDTGTVTAGSTAKPGGALNFTQTLAPDASGNINLSYASPSGYPLLSGLVISSGAPVPEASSAVSFGLLTALGLGGFAVARKRKSAAAN